MFSCLDTYKTTEVFRFTTSLLGTINKGQGASKIIVLIIEYNCIEIFVRKAVRSDRFFFN